MAMYDVRLESDTWQDRKRCLAEIAELLNIPFHIVTVNIETIEIILIVYKVYRNTLIFQIHNPNILLLPANIHMEMRQITHLLLEFCRQTHIIRNDDTHVILLFIKDSRQCTNNVCKSASLDKRYAFRCNISHFLHVFCPPISDSKSLVTKLL